VRLEWKISPQPLPLPASFVPIYPRRAPVAFALFPHPGVAEERRSFAEPLPIKFDGRTRCEWFSRDLFRGWIERLIHRHFYPRSPRDVNTATYRDAFAKGNLVSRKQCFLLMRFLGNWFFVQSKMEKQIPSKSGFFSVKNTIFHYNSLQLIIYIYVTSTKFLVFLIILFDDLLVFI